MPLWKSPKSERPTWMRSFAVLRTPAVMESRATIRPTPIETPNAVRIVRAGRRMRFFQTSPAQVTGVIFEPGVAQRKRQPTEAPRETGLRQSQLVLRRTP